MRIKYFLSLLLSFLILFNNNAFAETCAEHTISQAGTDLDTLKQKRQFKSSNGAPTDGEGKTFCQLDETEKEVDGNKCRVVILPFVKSSGGSDPFEDIKCIKFYIDLKDKNPSDAIERALANPTFKTNAQLMNDPIDYDVVSSSNLAKIEALKAKMKTRADAIVAASNITYGDAEEASKGNFLDEYLDLKVLNPLEYVNKKSWESPISVDLKEETSELNSIFKECAEKTQKIPAFSLEDMIGMIKDTIFDLEGQLVDMTTGMFDNVKDTIMDVTSDEAMFMYSIQALTKLIALAICKYRRHAGVASGTYTDAVAATMANVSAEACEKKLDTPDKAGSSEDSKEESCWALGTASSCFVKAFAGITFSWIGTERKSDDNAKKACKLLEEAVADEAYEMCMETEPDKVMRYILKVINLSVDGGEVEIGLVDKCQDKELQDRYKNKNYFDKAGNPYKNRITSFLNKGVDMAQNDIRDRMLGYVDDALETIRLDSAINQTPKQYTKLLESIKNNLTAKNFQSKYPQISTDLLDIYQKKYEEFQIFIGEEAFNINIKSALNALIGISLSGTASTPFAVTNDFQQILTQSDKFLYRLIASLPAYDYYMNFFIGQDISGFYTDSSGNDTIAQAVASSSGSPESMAKVFNISSDFVEDSDALATSFSEIMIDSMMTYYSIWKNVLIYLSEGFAFDYQVNNGELTYVIPVDDIKNIIKADLYKVFLDRYNTKKDINGVPLKSFNISYIINRLNKIKTLVQNAQTSGTDEDKKKVSKYILEYAQLILDYNLYLATYDLSNRYSMVSIIDSTNINLQNYFSQMNGSEVDDVQVNFTFFLKLLNIK